MVFDNREQAGEMLAEKLAAMRADPDAIVVALPRGGVPVGFALARLLELPLDIADVRKLGLPGREEVAMGAVSSTGLCVLKEEIIETFGIPSEVVEAVALRELREMERRRLLYHAARPRVKLEGKSVIVADDGLETGATMLAALKSLRREHPAKLIVAVPVACRDSEHDIALAADEAVCLHLPDSLGLASRWYRDYEEITDAQVISFLTEARQLQLALPHRNVQRGTTGESGELPLSN